MVRTWTVEQSTLCTSTTIPYNLHMQVTVLLFAGLKDAIGADLVEVELSENADINALWSQLEKEHPEAAKYDGRVAFALGDRLVRVDETLTAGVEVAVLPPVSGG